MLERLNGKSQVGSEVIIYTPLATFGYHIAEKLGVPCFFASVLPLTPTGMFGFLKFAQIAKNPLKKLINYATYLLVEFLHWQRYRPLLLGIAGSFGLSAGQVAYSWNKRFFTRRRQH
ncbi:hypothetical protein LC613_35525 [Nostoc sphaeroides CHAB 2801]|uniref:hypothetical protein n=1 Tax=Nostoc sphaeroides TaxID=446679 RepID=UPI001E32F5E9|nr:hypothetical protein [Nostoc sphaeroides]MCC5632859.1 hypothetical protein [Nostoc sphaeroides CHAB 2801]